MSQDALTSLLQLSSPVIGIAFTDTPPAGIKRIANSAPAGCAYWQAAANGETFYTTDDDHKACPIGAHTHHVETSDEEQQQLMALIQNMVGLSYIKMEEVATIPRRATPLRVAVYAPLASAPFSPEVLLIRGNPRQLMLLTEAAQVAGIAPVGPTMGRPTCAVLPAALDSQRMAASFGCIGNRVYTGATESEAYVAIPGGHLEAMVASLRTILNANTALEEFHRGKASAQSSSSDNGRTDHS
jgi:uncharacterized protein (DUF169 family)